MSGECSSQVTICEYPGTLRVVFPWGTEDRAVTLVHFLAATVGGSAVVSGGVGDGQAGTCGLRGLGGGRGSFGSGCSSIVTGGFSANRGSGQGPALGSCSVSGSGFSSGSGSSSSRGTILKKTVESSVKTFVTY